MKSIELSNPEIAALLHALQLEQANCKLYNAEFSQTKQDLLKQFEELIF